MSVKYDLILLNVNHCSEPIRKSLCLCLPAYVKNCIFKGGSIYLKILKIKCVTCYALFHTIHKLPPINYKYKYRIEIIKKYLFLDLKIYSF